MRIENADITGANPPAAERVHSWVAQNIHVQDRPEWVFVKVHTHGTQEAHADALLGTGAPVAAPDAGDATTTTASSGPCTT